MNNNNIILIGFKHTGKSSIGKVLAEKINCDFIDLDQQIENVYTIQYHETLRCRQIMQKQGEHFFRTMEHQVLQQTLEQEKKVIALGGGTPIKKENQILLQSHSSKIIHVTAPHLLVYERIKSSGLPAFFQADENPYLVFMGLWEERQPFYQTLADYTINNDKSIAEAIQNLLKVIKQ
jgi:shikimate kinase